MSISNKELRVLHCPHLVGGHAYSIAKNERLLGARSVCVSWQKSVFGYSADQVLWHPRDNVVLQEMARWRLLLRAIHSFNIIHYNYGSPILNWGALDNRHFWIGAGLGGGYAFFNRSFELPFVKMMGPVIAVTYQGDDARQGDYCRLNFTNSIANEVDENYYSSVTDQAKRKRIKRFSRYADLIYALNPDLLHILPAHAKFLPYAHVNFDEWVLQPEGNERYNSKPLVVHAPSNRKVKGTEYIIDAVNQLHNEGIAFDFRLVEGLEQNEAKNLYAQADLVIDQLFAGWYGGFSVEVMALGKPVICYLRREDFSFIPKEMANQIPIIESSPETIKSVLKNWLLKSPTERRNRGLKGRSYVECWHNPKLIAQRLLDDYRNIMISKGSICVE